MTQLPGFCGFSSLESYAPCTFNRRNSREPKTDYRPQAIRSERWRYIHDADDSEELSDMQADPNEWHNLAGKPVD